MPNGFLQKRAVDLVLAEDSTKVNRISRRALGFLAGLALLGRPLELLANDPCGPKGGMCEGNTCCPNDYHSTGAFCQGGGNCWTGTGGITCCDCYPNDREETDPNWLNYVCWCSEGAGGGTH
jgi:hypothetical protein